VVHRLYADENFPLQVVVALRQLGHDVLTVQDSGHAGQAVSDLAILTFANSQQRTVLTLNRRDFIRLHEQYPRHAGIIACTFDMDFIRQANRIHAVIVACDSLAGQLIRINRPA